MNSPMFHAGATLTVTSMLAAGGSVVIVPGFSTSNFWAVVESSGATCCTLMGAMASFLVRADGPERRRHGLQRVCITPFTQHAIAFAGDAFRRTHDGDYVFVDRLKDVIRRRGENVSSVEVEAEALTHPAVAQAGAVGVPSEYAEEEILLAVEPVAGAGVDPGQLVEHLIERLPYFMVPRYIRVVAELSLTPTGKVRKSVLREEGIAAGAWDREAAGILLKRERLS